MVDETSMAIEAFDKLKPKIRNILIKLQRQLGYYVPEEELMSEAQERWISTFENYYVDDDQFLRFMFVIMRNKIRDLKKESYRYQRMHVSDPARLSGLTGDVENQIGHVRIWNEMAEDTREELPPTNAEIREWIALIEKNLVRDFHRKIFRLLVHGLPHKQIAEELGCSAGHVAKTKQDHIWPTVKKVMNLPDEMYDKLIDSGRIYCP